MVILALSSAILSTVSYYSSKGALENALEQQIEQISHSTMQNLDYWIAGLQRSLGTWSSQKVFQLAVLDSFVGVNARKSANAELDNLHRSHDEFEGIHVANTNGLVVASCNTNDIEKVNVSDRPYFRAALEGKTSISSPVKSKGTGNPVVIIATPMKGDNGMVVGALLGVVSLENMSKRFVDAVKVLDSGYIFVYEPAGLIVAHKNRAHIFNLDLKKYDWGKRLLAESAGAMRYEFESAVKYVAFDKSEKLGWGIAATVFEKEMMAPVIRSRNWNLFVCLISLTGCAFVLVFVANSITKPLNHAIKNLNQTAIQLASGADQISHASQSLASGAGEQAASLEETSSSLEEMASMTHRNANNAEKANGFSKQTRESAEKGTEKTQAMMKAMDGIQASGEAMHKAMNEVRAANADVAKIIKTIDEIAFQTNILALNAAVEAARAGAAGMGFAVVADEVRNLAQKSAEAARETASRIEGAISKTENSVLMSDKVSQELKSLAVLSHQVETSLGEILTRAREVDQLVGDISAASKEQNAGIQQVNTAVSQMDHVTQANAASAEESASAATELSSQADILKAVVEDLVTLSEGGRTSSEVNETSAHNGSSLMGKMSSSQTGTRKVSSAIPNSSQVTPIERQTVVLNQRGRNQQPSPQPFDDGFKDF